MPLAREIAAWPEPDRETRERSERLCERIREEIRNRGGAIPFSRYMELALYAPGLGYYSCGPRPFGPEGDFVTAPEVSPLFSRCLARQCSEVIDQLGGGEILELGAGSGALAADLLAELDRLGRLPLRYSILEVSGALAAQQRATVERRMRHLGERIQWLERLPDTGFRGVVLANEVLDAMPVSRFRVSGGEVLEAQVTEHDGIFTCRYASRGTPELAGRVAQLESQLGRFPSGYESELNPSLQPWVRSVADFLAAGLVLIIDYGYPRREYYAPERSMGTLMCHYRHRAHAEPLIWTGLQDITAHVDFTAIAEAGASCGLNLAGYTSQAHFLLACGLDRLVAESDPRDLPAHLERMQELKRLTLPSEMGERFKVIGLARELEVPLLGFSGRDLRYSL
jgi:SAM-dependent MidA family methyltransferase